MILAIVALWLFTILASLLGGYIWGYNRAAYEERDPSDGWGKLRER